VARHLGLPIDRVPFLAFCMALVGLSFLILGVETHGKAIVLDHGTAR
jgi:hypothetical protein